MTTPADEHDAQGAAEFDDAAVVVAAAVVDEVVPNGDSNDGDDPWLKIY